MKLSRARAVVLKRFVILLMPSLVESNFAFYFSADLDYPLSNDEFVSEIPKFLKDDYQWSGNIFFLLGLNCKSNFHAFETEPSFLKPFIDNVTRSYPTYLKPDVSGALKKYNMSWKSEWGTFLLQYHYFVESCSKTKLQSCGNALPKTSWYWLFNCDVLTFAGQTEF